MQCEESRERDQYGQDELGAGSDVNPVSHTSGDRRGREEFSTELEVELRYEEQLEDE